MRNTKTRIAAEILAGIALIFAFYSGTQVGQATPDLHPTTNSLVTMNAGISPTVEYRLLERRPIRDIEEPVVVVEYVEQVIRVPLELDNFYNLEELTKWLREVDLKTNTVYFQSPNNRVDCDDYAIA